MIYSTSPAAPRPGATPLYVTQISAMVLGTVALLICLGVDYRSLADRAHFIYAGLLILLVYVLFFGVVRGGGRRWIPLPWFNLQPSEFMKIGLALMLARLFGETRHRTPTGHDLLIAGALTAVPLLLIARQPDLGTAATLVPIVLFVALVAGMRLKVAGILLAAGRASLSPLVWNYAPQGLPEGAGPDLRRPVARSARRRLPADSGADCRRGRRPLGQGLPQGHPGPAELPAGQAQRLHLLGAGRRARVRRRALGPRRSTCSSSCGRSKPRASPRTGWARCWSSA